MILQGTIVWTREGKAEKMGNSSKVLHKEQVAAWTSVILGGQLLSMEENSSSVRQSLTAESSLLLKLPRTAFLGKYNRCRWCQATEYTRRL